MNNYISAKRESEDEIMRLVAHFSALRKIYIAEDTSDNDRVCAFESMDAIIAPLNRETEKAFYYDLLARSVDETHAMRNACKALSFDGYIFDKTNISLERKEKMIDLKKLHKMSVSGIGANVEWQYESAALRAVMTAALCADVRISSANSDCSFWDLSAATHTVNSVLDGVKVPRKAWKYISNDETVSLSKSRQRAMLTRLVHDMIGDVKVNSYDFKWLYNAFASYSAGKGLKTSNQQKFNQLLLTVCHAILTGEQYEVTYKMRDMDKPNPRYN